MLSDYVLACGTAALACNIIPRHAPGTSATAPDAEQHLDQVYAGEGQQRRSYASGSAGTMPCLPAGCGALCPTQHCLFSTQSLNGALPSCALQLASCRSACTALLCLQVAHGCPQCCCPVRCNGAMPLVLLLASGVQSLLPSALQNSALLNSQVLPSTTPSAAERDVVRHAATQLVGHASHQQKWQASRSRYAVFNRATLCRCRLSIDTPCRPCFQPAKQQCLKH